MADISTAQLNSYQNNLDEEKHIFLISRRTVPLTNTFQYLNTAIWQYLNVWQGNVLMLLRNAVLEKQITNWVPIELYSKTKHSELNHS